jgi:hypothetical protein
LNLLRREDQSPHGAPGDTPAAERFLFLLPSRQPRDRMKLSNLVGFGLMTALMVAGSALALTEVVDTVAEPVHGAMHDAFGLTGVAGPDIEAKLALATSVATAIASNIVGQANSAVTLASSSAGSYYDMTHDLAYMNYQGAYTWGGASGDCYWNAELSAMDYQYCSVGAADALVAL